MNAHEVLGVASDASQAVIKRAYRRLAQKLHPDKPSGDAERYKLIKEAYEFLTSGRSSTSKFTTPNSVPSPSPTDHPAHVTVHPPIEVAFRGGWVDATARWQRLKVYVPVGARHGHNVRTRASMPDGTVVPIITTVIFQDPSKFFFINDGYLNCKYVVTYAQLLAQEEHSFRNPDPAVSDVSFTIPSNVQDGDCLTVLHAGLPRVNGGRDPLRVHLSVKYVPLDREIYPNLEALRSRLDELIAGYQHVSGKKL